MLLTWPMKVYIPQMFLFTSSCANSSESFYIYNKPFYISNNKLVIKNKHDIKYSRCRRVWPYSKTWYFSLSYLNVGFSFDHAPLSQLVNCWLFVYQLRAVCKQSRGNQNCLSVFISPTIFVFLMSVTASWDLCLHSNPYFHVCLGVVMCFQWTGFNNHSVSAAGFPSVKCFSRRQSEHMQQMKAAGCLLKPENITRSILFFISPKRPVQVWGGKSTRDSSNVNCRNMALIKTHI